MSTLTFSWQDYVNVYASKAKLQFKAFLFEYFNDYSRWTRPNGDYFNTGTLGRILSNVHNNAYHYILDIDTMDHSELAAALADYICGPNFQDQRSYLTSFFEHLSKDQINYEHPRLGRISAKEMPQFTHFKQHCFVTRHDGQTKHPIAT
jgi:hypothetical protein